MSVAVLLVIAGFLVLYEVGGARRARRGDSWPLWRRVSGWAAAMCCGAVVGLQPLVRPGGALWIETLQFALLTFVVAPLVALADPSVLRWPIRTRGGYTHRAESDEHRAAALAGLGGFLAVTIAWRLPVLVDALATTHWLIGVEIVTLVGGSLCFWVAVGGLTPQVGLRSRPWRIGCVACALWSVWIFAYAVGFSGHRFYPAYGTVRGAVGGQEWAVALLWVMSALSLVPVAFVSLAGWIRAEQLIAEAETVVYRGRFGAPRPQVGYPHRGSTARWRTAGGRDGDG